MEKQRVLFVLGTMSFGGAERQVIEILRRLRRDAFAPSLYLINREGELLDQVPDDVAIFSYWDRHKYPRLNWPGRILRSQARDLAAIIRDNAIDVVYDHGSLMTLTSALATKRTTVKRVSVAHSDPEKDFAALHRRFASVKWHMLRRAYKSADRVAAVSDGVRQGLIRFFDLPAEQVTTCYNIFDVARLEAMAEGPSPEFKPNRFHLVSVGRLQGEKGLDFLLEAMDELVNRRSMTQLLLWLVGNGPDEASLRRMAADRHLGDHVRFEDFQENPMPYVRKAHLFCLPSLTEGMPNALVEAMIAKTPVLASDCPSGPREILVDGEHGRLVSPGNWKQLADGIEDAVNDYSAWQQRTGGAYQFVADTFSSAAGMRRIETLLQEVASDGRK